SRSVSAKCACWCTPTGCTSPAASFAAARPRTRPRPSRRACGSFARSDRMNQPTPPPRRPAATREPAAPRYSTVSDMEIEPLYTPDDLNGWRYDDHLGAPGEYPFTRGAYPSMYRG